MSTRGRSRVKFSPCGEIVTIETLCKEEYLNMNVIDKSFEFVDEYVSLYIERRINGGSQRPLFIFVTGPQGSGKTFTSDAIANHLSEKYRVASASIDDFYLTHEDQVKFSKTFAKNALLQGRGLPGTHDIRLLTECVETILKGKEGFVELPTYDKSLWNGSGDRSAFKKVELPLQVFVLEGWFLGFMPILSKRDIDSHPLLQGSSDMVQVNANLLFYRDLLWGNPQINSLGIVFEADDIKDVYEWRLDQERALRKAKGSGMTDEEVKKFVDRYWPSYELYYEDLVKSEDLGSVATLTLGIDLQRKVFCVKNRCIE